MHILQEHPGKSRKHYHKRLSYWIYAVHSGIFLILQFRIMVMLDHCSFIHIRSLWVMRRYEEVSLFVFDKAKYSVTKAELVDLILNRAIISEFFDVSAQLCFWWYQNYFPPCVQHGKGIIFLPSCVIKFLSPIYNGMFENTILTKSVCSIKKKEDNIIFEQKCR